MVLLACNGQHWRLRFKTVDKMCLLLTESIDCNWLNEWMIDQGVRSRWFMDQMSNLDWICWICLNICRFGTFKFSSASGLGTIRIFSLKMINTTQSNSSLIDEVNLNFKLNKSGSVMISEYLISNHDDQKKIFLVHVEVEYELAFVTLQIH